MTTPRDSRPKGSNTSDSADSQIILERRIVPYDMRGAYLLPTEGFEFGDPSMDAFHEFSMARELKERLAQQASTYPSRPLLPENHEIRLLRLLPGAWSSEIKCSLQICSLRDRPAYEALSYTWGRSVKGRTIVLDSVPQFPVTDNAWNAMRRFRLPDKERILWLDAICISQGLLSERQQQVTLMNEIYSRSERCLVWLGEVDNAVPGTIRLGGPHYRPRSSANGDERALAALEHVFWYAQPSWWERVWVVQEAVLAPSLLICFGPYEATWGDFCWDFLQLSTPDKVIPRGESSYPAKYILEDKYPIRESMRNRFSALDQLRRPQKQRSENYIAARDLCGTLEVMQSLQCSDRRDRIYGILSIIDPIEAQLVPADYKRPWVEVYARATYASIVKRRNLSIWRHLSTLTTSRPHMFHGLPSWALHWNQAIDIELSHWSYWRKVDLYDNRWTTPRDGDQPFKPKLSKDVACLTLQGYEFDRIVSKEVLFWVRAMEHFESPPAPPLMELLYSAVMHLRVACSYRDIGEHRIARSGAEAEVQQPSRGSTDASFTQRLESLRRGEGEHNKIPYRMRPCDAFALAFQIWSERAGVPHDIRARAEEFAVSDVCSFWSYCVDAASDAALIVTETGFIGLAPMSTEVGDHIVLLQNWRMPVVLRPLKLVSDLSYEGCFSFQGFAHVHGIMHNELVSMGKDEALVSRDFALR